MTPLSFLAWAACGSLGLLMIVVAVTLAAGLVSDMVEGWRER